MSEIAGRCAACRHWKALPRHQGAAEGQCWKVRGLGIWTPSNFGCSLFEASTDHLAKEAERRFEEMNRPVGDSPTAKDVREWVDERAVLEANAGLREDIRREVATAALQGIIAHEKEHRFQGSGRYAAGSVGWHEERRSERAREAVLLADALLVELAKEAK